MVTERKKLTFKDRRLIEKALKDGVPVNDIAKTVKAHKTTVFREIRRGYSAEKAQHIVDLNWKNGNRCKSSQNIVQQWREVHPNGKKADCIRETGLSKPTVYKWWNEIVPPGGTK